MTDLSADGLPVTHPFWVLAREFGIAVEWFYATPQTRPGRRVILLT